VNKCHLLERENESLKAIQSLSTETSSAETSELQTVVATLEVQLQDARNLNGLLHGQLSSVSKALAQLESERDSRIPVSSQVNAAGEQNESIQQIHELQEIIKFMRSEREMLESQLNLARRAVERERSAAEVSKRALEAARAEIDISVARQLQDDNNESTTDLTSKMKAYDDQMKMMRESNQLLRDEVDKLSAQLLIAQQERISAVNALDPMTKERQSLEIQNAALEVEKSSLIKEVDGWKERVQSLVTKFHQVMLL
jgi:nucleoprotein TPR